MTYQIDRFNKFSAGRAAERRRLLRLAALLRRQGRRGRLRHPRRAPHRRRRPHAPRPARQARGLRARARCSLAQAHLGDGPDHQVIIRHQ